MATKKKLTKRQREKAILSIQRKCDALIDKAHDAFEAASNAAAFVRRRRVQRATNAADKARERLG